MDVVGFGAINLDMIYYCEDIEAIERFVGRRGGREHVNRERLDDLTEWLKENAEFKVISGGGSAANTCVGLAKLGFDCGFIGKVGADPEGEFLIEEFADVDTSKIIRDGTSGTCIVLIDPEGERSMLITPNCNDTLHYGDIDLEYATRARFLHLSSFAGEKPFQAQRQLIQELDGRVKVSFDPGELHSNRGIVELKPILERTSILFITDKEIEILTSKGYKDGARVLRDCGVEIVACKRGKLGAYILSDNEEFSLPAQDVKVVDKTGGGDLFNTGFLAGLLENKFLHESTKLGIKIASVSITGYGRQKYPSISV